MIQPNPKAALDYPKIPDEKFIIWYSNDVKWPHGARVTTYMTSNKKHPLNDSCLMSTWADDAVMFETEDEAKSFFYEQTEKRGFPYHNINITTVSQMKIKRGYA